MAKSDAKGSARQRELLEAALNAAGLGIPVIPVYEVEGGICACGKASNCPSPGKHPRVKDWQAQATTDEKQIRDWWKKWPTASIGGAGGALEGPRRFVQGSDLADVVVCDRLGA